MTQLAFCYAIGFGTARNEVESRRLLGSHNINAEQLEAMKLRCLKESSYNLPDVVRKLLENSHLQQINNTSHYLRQGVIDEAERELNREYRDLVGSFGKESLLAMGAMSRLIGVYLVRKKAQEAELLIRELMGLYQNIPEGNQTGVLTCLYTLATIYSDQLRWKEAEDLYRQVIEKRTELLGESHIATLSAWNGLAVMYGSQKRWDMVEDIMQRVVSTMETTLGENHPSTMVYLGNLASAYGKRGMWEKAEEIQRLVVASSTKIQGAEHPSTLTSKANLGSALFNQGKMAEAEELLKEVIETGTKVMALEEEEARNNRYAHLDSVSIWVGNLQSMYETQGRFGESRSLAERGMEMQGLVQPAGEPRTVEELRDMILRGIEEGDQDRLGKLGGILTGWQEGLTRLLKDGFGEVEEDHVED
ncbi:TPR-like protein [Nemania abortiva]|nr:TPR-like protein [Nemania abortiva]